MSSGPVQTFWNSVGALVQDGISRSNNESEQRLEFVTIPNGFQVCRESPFLVVERWLDDNQIHGMSKTKSSGGRVTPGPPFPPLTIIGQNEASWPEDPTRKPTTLTAADIANGTLDIFQ